MIENSRSRLLTDHNIARSVSLLRRFFYARYHTPKIDLASPAAASTRLGIQKRLFDKRFTTLNER